MLETNCVFRTSELDQLGVSSGDELRVRVVAKNPWGLSEGCEEVAKVLEWPVIAAAPAERDLWRWKWVLLGLALGLLSALLLVAIAAFIYWCCRRGRQETVRYVDEFVYEDVDLPPEKKLITHDPIQEITYVTAGRKEVPWRSSDVQNVHQGVYPYDRQVKL